MKRDQNEAFWCRNAGINDSVKISSRNQTQTDLRLMADNAEHTRPTRPPVPDLHLITVSPCRSDQAAQPIPPIITTFLQKEAEPT